MYVPFKPFSIKSKLQAVTVHIENTVFAKRANQPRNGRHLRLKLYRHLYSGVELNKVSYSKTQDNDLINPTSALLHAELHCHSVSR